MKIGFICSTPYHIILSFHLSKILHIDQKDIFIANHFNNASLITEKIGEIQHFNNVFFVDDGDMTSSSIMMKIKRFIRFLKMDFSSVISNKVIPNYDTLYVFSQTNITKMMVSHCLTNNSNLNIHLLEDGIETYIASTVTKDQKIKIWIDKIIKLFGRRYFNYNLVHSINLFEPGLYIGNLVKKVCRLPSIDWNDENLKTILNSIFLYKKNDLYHNTDFIYFEQCFSRATNNKIDEKMFLKTILNYIPHSRLLIKLHPLDDINKYQENNIQNIVCENFPWEIIYFNENLRDKILITVHSTAVFSTKILFNQEHNIIFLYKIFDIQVEEYGQLIGRLKEIYTQKKIYEPSTLDELKQIITENLNQRENITS